MGFSMKYIASLFFLLLVSCSSHQGVNSNLLLPGMTKQEVINTIGLPYKKEARGKLEKYKYSNIAVCFDENGLLKEMSWTCHI